MVSQLPNKKILQSFVAEINKQRNVLNKEPLELAYVPGYAIFPSLLMQKSLF